SNSRCLALRINERENRVSNISVILRLHPAPVERMRSLIIERIALDSVDAEDTDTAVLDKRAEGANHALAFLFVLVAHAGGESEDRRTVIPVNGDAHVS